MPTPFLGMDPYLERRGLWEDVHTRRIVAIAEALAPQVRPNYRVAVEQRTYLLVMAPDDLIGQSDVLLLMEIDLLRAGDPMAMRIAGNGHKVDYRIVVSRAQQRPSLSASESRQ